MRSNQHVFLIADWRQQTRNNSVPPELETGSRERVVVRAPAEDCTSLCRLCCALAHPHAGVLFGSRRGEGTHEAVPAPVLEGIKRVDGMLIVRVAGVTFDRLGWENEGENDGLWERDSTSVLGMHSTSKVRFIL